MRLQVSQEFCPPCIGSARVLTFFYCLFSAILVPKKRKENENADVFFGRKIKRRKIKNAFSGAEKLKENEIRSP